MIKIENLSKTFRTEQVETIALNNVSLEVKDGEIFVWESDCPNQICVREGAVSRAGQTIVCAPNKMTVTVTGGEEGGVDAITQ